MLRDYLPILMQFVMAAGFAGVTILLSTLLGKKAPAHRGDEGVKQEAYECGMLPTGDGQPRFSVKFYLIAMLFVIFDIEVVFLYPWAVVFTDFIEHHGIGLFWSVLSFVGILAVAYLYVLKKKALHWAD